MKKLLFLMILLAGVTSFASGQERVKKTIELKIGLSVTGYVMELEDGNYMMETDAGDIVFYSRDEIRSIKSPEEVKKEAELKSDNSPVRTSIPKRYTLTSLLDYYGIQAKLEQYKSFLVEGNKKQADAIEDALWEIEQKVTKDVSIPESVRDEFFDYIESSEDRIEKEAKRERKRR